MTTIFARHPSFADALRRALSWPARVGEARRTLTQLSRMSDHELSDIGLPGRTSPTPPPCRIDEDPTARSPRRAGRARPSPRRRTSPPDRAHRPPPQVGRNGLRRRFLQRSSRPTEEPPMTAQPAAIQVHATSAARQDEILSNDALAFLADLHRRFDARRRELLARRTERQKLFDAGETPGFPDRDARPSATATGRSRRSPPISSTAASRSPARSTAR